MSLLTLSIEQKQDFDNNGYLLLKNFYDAAEVAAMRREYPDLKTSDTPLWNPLPGTSPTSSTRATW